MARARQQLVIIGLGFFALIAQTLLFRDFLGTLESNEIAVGAFFCSWLCWVGIGAMAGRLLLARWSGVLARFLWLVPLYLPAFIGQQLLIDNGRLLLGVEAFVLLPLPQLLLFAAVGNAPVSFCTGLFFTLACRWAKAVSGLPVARIYILETFGGFVGGLAVTLMLAGKMSGEQVFVLASWVLLTTTLIGALARGNRLWLWGILVLLLLGSRPAVEQAGPAWSGFRARNQWQRLLGESDSYRGRFTTAQAHYLYGERKGDFLVMDGGGVVEVLPEEEHAAAVAAWAMAQNPKAARILVIGSGGLATGDRLHRLPQIREVVWLSPDPELPQQILAVLPPRLRERYGRITTPGQDVRRYLGGGAGRFDLILVNVAEPHTLVLNRYVTTTFFSQIAAALAPGGVCGIRLAGAANYLGDERMLAGASVFASFGEVFAHLAIKPGDESFLFGAKEPVVSSSGGELAARYERIDGAVGLYPPEGLSAAYQQDRADFQLSRYRQGVQQFGTTLLRNSDMHPKALLFELLLTLRKAGGDRIVPMVLFLVGSGIALAGLAIGLFGVLRLVYRYRLSRSLVPASGTLSPADAGLVLTIAGLTGMALTVVMMFCYQLHFGSLFLDVGIIASLFMLGSALGGAAVEWLMQRAPRHDRVLLILSGLQVGLLLLLGLVLPGETGRLTYAILFTGAGLSSGAYFPLAAQALQDGGYSVESGAGRLELFDHLGGGIGALFCGLGLLPLLGVHATLAVLGATQLVVNLTSLPQQLKGSMAAGDLFERVRRPLGYLLFGIGLLALAGYHNYHRSQGRGAESQFIAAATELAEGVELRAVRTKTVAGREYFYFATAGGYIFPSAPFTEGIRGYGGEIPLAIRLDTTGNLVDFRLLRCRETPVYLGFLRGWLAGLQGRNLFDTKPFGEVQAVTGATMSSVAIMRSLEVAATSFGVSALGRPLAAEAAGHGPASTLGQVVLLGMMFLLVVLLRRKPQRRQRLMVLTASFLLFGPWLNLQYSMQQVMMFMGGNFSFEPSSGSFFLIVLVPVLVGLFGNIYCGYLCPFGALQELVGELRPAGWIGDPSRAVWRYGRLVKYLLLLFFVLCFVITDDYTVLQSDPLITSFGAVHEPLITGMALWLVLLALFFRRFWCRNLCPAGAFLALVGGLRLLRRFLPVTQPGRCDLGVRTGAELDCLQCDRCRHAKN